MAFAVPCAGAGRAPEASAACSGMPPSLVLGRTCWAGRRGRAPLLSAVSETIFNGEGISKPVLGDVTGKRCCLLLLIQPSLYSLSYVQPSLIKTGSRMLSMVMGQMKESGISSNRRPSSAPSKISLSMLKQRATPKPQF